MRPATIVQLPGGWLDAAGVLHPEAAVRALSGHDEEWLYGRSPATPLAPLVTALLWRCLTRVGRSRPTPDVLRALPVGDREYLLLELYRLTFGSRVDSVLTCPRPQCGARMDVDFELDSLPVRRSPQQAAYRLEWGADGVEEVWFRLPRGGDLEELGTGATGADLLGRCVLGPEAVAVGRSPALAAAVEAELERRSPGVEREIEAICPECGHGFATTFDPAGAFLAEVWRRRPELDQDVHLLSFHYHWPLSEILGMARPRRRAYVALLLGQLESGAWATVAR